MRSKKDDIARKLRRLSRQMIDVGTAMDYFGGFDGRMAEHGLELVGAGLVVEEWADEIDKRTEDAARVSGVISKE
jgi:hypothetical protein